MSSSSGRNPNCRRKPCSVASSGLPGVDCGEVLKSLGRNHNRNSNPRFIYTYVCPRKSVTAQSLSWFNMCCTNIVRSRTSYLNNDIDEIRRIVRVRCPARYRQVFPLGHPASGILPWPTSDNIHLATTGPYSSSAASTTTLQLLYRRAYAVSPWEAVGSRSRRWVHQSTGIVATTNPMARRRRMNGFEHSPLSSRSSQSGSLSLSLPPQIHASCTWVRATVYVAMINSTREAPR